MGGRFAGFLFVVAIVTSCVGISRPGAVLSPTASAIPWISSTPASLLAPTPTPTLIPTGTPPCSSREAIAIYGGTGALTGGQVAGSLVLGNRSDHPCVLEGTPAISLRDKAGRVREISVR